CARIEGEEYGNYVGGW
nr:immunoglobulin heavy chain junction region [Mus musculus]